MKHFCSISIDSQAIRDSPPKNENESFTHPHIFSRDFEIILGSTDFKIYGQTKKL